MSPKLKEEFPELPEELKSSILKYQDRKLTNLQIALSFLRHHPSINKIFVYNEVESCIEKTREVPDLLFESHKDHKSTYSTAQLDDYQRLISWLEVYGINVPKDRFIAEIINEAKKESYNPIREKLEKFASKWDNKPRLSTFFATIFHKENSLYLTEIGTRFMIAAVARALVQDKPYKFDWIPVLSGGQGFGKSQFCRTLFGSCVKEGLPANLGDKDAKQELRGKWCIELSELTSMKVSTNETIKSFLSTVVDEYRPSYGKDLQRFPRRCVFVGTTNETEFLTDTTGNRRFMPIFLEEPIDIKWLKKNRVQLWGEAYSLYKENPNMATWIPDTILEEVNALHQKASVHDMLEEHVLSYLNDPDSNSRIWKQLDTHGGEGFTLANLATNLHLSLNGSHKKRLSTILRKHGYSSHQVRTGGERLRLWRKEDDKQN